MSDEPSLLQLRNVAKSFRSPDGSSQGVPVLRSIDLQLARGESLSIVGPSGSGKSTLLNLIGSLETPDSGQLLWLGDDLAGRNESALAEFRNQEIGFVFQHHHLLPQCTAVENVLLPTLAQNGSRVPAEAAQRAEHLLHRVGLKDRMRHLPAQLSGGERQRVAVVRALINDPAMLLADEPTGSLDGASAAALGDLLVELNAEHDLALVVVTHSKELAGRMARQVELQDGCLVELQNHG
jgi:lipoprotein-releasing system ATP-binding protein